MSQLQPLLQTEHALRNNYFNALAEPTVCSRVLINFPPSVMETNYAAGILTLSRREFSRFFSFFTPLARGGRSFPARGNSLCAPRVARAWFIGRYRMIDRTFVGRAKRVRDWMGLDGRANKEIRSSGCYRYESARGHGVNEERMAIGGFG